MKVPVEVVGGSINMTTALSSEIVSNMTIRVRNGKPTWGRNSD